MPKNKRQTSEELKAIEEEALEEGKKQKIETKEDKLEKEVQENLDKEKIEVKEDDPKVPDPEADVKDKPKVDLKKKLSASARENQKILAKNRTMTKALADAEDIPEPTEDEVKKEYGEDDYELMSDTEKKMAKETLTGKRWRIAIAQAKEQASKIDKWGEKVGGFINDPQTLIDNPKLEGKTNSFIQFATKDEHNSVPLNILVSAFLHENSSNKKANKGRQFQKGSGGPNSKPIPKSNKISLEEARVLKASDYAEYKRKLNSNLIDISV